MKRNMILIADDVEMNRLLLAQIFSSDYTIVEAENGIEVLKKLEKYHDNIAVILLDIIMPKMDGLEVLKKLKNSGETKDIPVIFITGASDDTHIIHKAYSLGIVEIISKPIEIYSTKQRVLNIINLYNEKYSLSQTNKEQAEKINHTNEIIINAMASLVETRAGDDDTGIHITNIKNYTEIILSYLNKTEPRFNWSKETIQKIVLAATFHDIGKILIPESILLKPGRLTTEEFGVMKQHTIFGCNILRKLNELDDKSFYQYCYDICRHHHEKWDGTGYPDGLKENDIPIHAHVVSIADVYDALTHKRIYKEAFSHEQAIKMIKNGECGQFAPWILKALDAVEEKFKSNLLATTSAT